MKEWNAQYYMWKSHDKSELNLIKSYVGLLLFNKPEGDDDIDFETVYTKYDEKKTEIINGICDKFQFDDDRLRLSHTLLYLHQSKCDYPICIFRQMRANGEIHFIDLNERVYTSWIDFVKTNKLPKCDYIAPRNGIHHLVTDEVEVHKTPASSKIGNVCDNIALGATITSIGLSCIAAAPVIALALGGGSAVYGVKQSYGALRDRKKHGQSIAPSNLESVNCYLNIGTTAICGASALTLIKSARIIEMSGKYSSLSISAIKGVNYTAAASTFAGVGLNLYSMQLKYRHDKLSSSDWIDLCVNVFLMYGTITNVRRMRTYLSNSNANPSPPEGLSKGARRRWRKARAKLLDASDSSKNQNVSEVGTWDPEIFNFMVRSSNEIFSRIMMRQCPSLYAIYSNVCMIVEDFHNFYHNKIKLDVFCTNIINHGRNLYKLLKNDSREIKDAVIRFLQRCGVIASSESIDEISNIIDDAVLTINNVNEENLLEDECENEDEPFPTDCMVYKMILDLVKHRICRNKVDTTEDLFSAFAQELSSVTNEIKSKVIQEYEEMLSNNIRLMGEKKAKMVLSQIGINSGNDIASKTIQQIIDKLKTDDEVDISVTFEKQLDELFSLYADLFLIIADGDDGSSIQVLETCEILNNSIELVIQPFLEFFKKGKESYEMNIKFFGHENAMVFVLATLDLNLNDVTLNGKNFNEMIFFDIAKKKLNLCEIVPQLLPIEENTDDLNDESVQFTDDFKIETLLSVCNFYVQRIGSNEMTRVYSFITDKFIDHIQSLGNEQKQNTSISDIIEKLKFNINILGQSNFNMMCRVLCETDRFEIINQVAETFKKEEFVVELIAEYNAKMHHNTNFHAGYFKHLLADDGATIHTRNVGNRDDIEELKQQAASLLKLNKYCIDVVSKAENLILLKHADKYVVFQFIKNETDTLIMQIDLSKKKPKNK